MTAPAAWAARLRARGRMAARRALIAREAGARAAPGMPARHPELMAGWLPRRQQRQLAELAARLWAHDEYVQIILHTRPEASP